MHIRKTAIDMSEEGRDVNIEYEKLFGSAKKVNLFETEEEYNELRQTIMAESQLSYSSDSLPFENFDIIIANEEQNCEKKEKSVIEDFSKAPKRNDKKSQARQSEIGLGYPNKHFFYIKEDGICDAKGYYNEELKFFFICKDSYVSYDTDLLYMINDTENARDNFIRKICKEEKGCYRVTIDAKCRSASAAACYVLGYQSDQTRWKDSDGNLLSDLYPEIFSVSGKQANIEPQKEEQSSKVEEPTTNKNELHKEEKTKKTIKDARLGRPPRYYYISRKDVGRKSCDARGEYDKTSNKFIILTGSVLASEVTSSYRYSASDIKRQKFIQRYCGLTRDHFKLRNDGICNSPDEAACFVLGENANGWVEWKSKDGLSLESVISKV